MKVTAKLVCALVVAGAAASAFAQPRITRVVNNPSSIFVYGSNSDDRAYNCQITMVWSSKKMDGGRNVYTVNQPTGLPPRAQDAEILRVVGAHVDVRVDQAPAIQC